MARLTLGGRHLAGAACAVLVAASATWAAVPASAPGPQPSAPSALAAEPAGPTAASPSGSSTTGSSTTGSTATVPTGPDTPTTGGTAPAQVPAALTSSDLDLRSGPVPVAIELRLPTIDAAVAVLGVGITDADVMDAPMGGRGDPVWEQAFWYRGSAVPGAASTAVVAGHVGGAGGGPGAFGRLDELAIGDPIVVRDTRTGQDVRFVVEATATYTLAEAAEPAVLARMYGEGPATGLGPQPSADGRSHLTLVTCAGVFRGTTHDQRLAVYATRVS